MSAEIILFISVLLQFTAAAVALRLSWSLRHHAWSLIALAIFLMGLRRTLTLHGALVLNQPVDTVAETVALVISSLMLLGLLGLGRRFTRPGEGFWASAWPLTLLNRTAVLFGGLTILGSTAISLLAYSASYKVTLEHSIETNLSLASTLASYADRQHLDDQVVQVKSLETLWEKIRPSASIEGDREEKPRSGRSYFCIVRADGTLAAHSSRLDLVGTSVGDMTLGNSSGHGPRTLGQLAATGTGWAGHFVARDGETQVAAFVPARALDALVAVHVPLAEIEADFRHRNLPYIAGLALISFGLLPLSLLLLHRAYLASQKKLRESEQRMKLALEGTSDGMWDWDVASGAVSYDDNWQRVLGYESGEQEFDFEWWERSVHPESKPVFEQAFAAYLEGREKYYELEYRIRTRSGDWIWVWARGVCIEFGKKNEPLRLIGTHRDVTRERALEEQLRQAQKMEAVGQLAGGVAHDFNNLLQVIQIHTELAMARTPASSELGKSLAEIGQAAERAAGLTHRLLAFSRRQVLHPVDLNLHQVLNDLAQMLRRIIGEDVEVRVVGAAGHVRADRGQLEEAVMNLCVNARDAMAGGGVLTLEISDASFDEAACRERPSAKPGEFVVLAVTDTGCGMPKEELGKIFEPFYTTKEVGQGSGLGLSMVSGIVEQHQGWIEVDSEPGRGTTFRLYFPRTEPGGAGSEKPVRDLPGGGAETILLVEDEEGVRQVAARILEEAGYEVLVARNGAEAVDLFKKASERVALVVLDVVMPVMGGAEARGEIRKIDRETRFLFTTGYDKSAFSNEALRLTPILAKPYASASLLRKVREILDGARQASTSGPSKGREPS